jgi:hypothetical protein
MTRYLHLVPADGRALAGLVIAAQAAEAGATVTVVVLYDGAPPELPPGVRVRRLAPGDLDHRSLLDLIFEHDRVITW